MTGKKSIENWRNKRRKLIRELRSKPCIDCGESYPWYVMEFDHCRGEKSFGIAETVSRGFGKARLEEELAKCDVVCANCHRKRTFQRLSHGGVE